MTTPPRSCRLPLSFNAVELLSEVERLSPRIWTPHFNAEYHNGGWMGVALRNGDGNSARLYVNPADDRATRDTAVLADCPRLNNALNAFACPLRGARLLRLAPGGVIELHRDPDLIFEAGQARLHVPLTTNPGVEFYVDGERIIMSPGECWYLDLSRLHRVVNRGASDRIHLVIDAVVNDWLRAQINAGAVPDVIAAAPTGATEFDRFREMVFADAAVAETLRGKTDAAAFVDLCVEWGIAYGCRFAPEDVRAAMARGREQWVSQWIV